MARKKLDPLEADRRKKARAAERRRLRKLGQPTSSPRKSRSRKGEIPPVPNLATDWSETIAVDGGSLKWLTANRMRDAAHRIVNQSRMRPYYVSIYWPKGSGVEPSFGFHPCGYFFSANRRIYYSFALPEHRDAVFEAHRDTKLRARKETHDAVVEAHKTARSGQHP